MKLLILSFLLFSVSAYSTGSSKDDDQRQDQNQDQKQYQDQEQWQSTESSSDATAINEGNIFSTTTTTTIKASAPDIVMVPNNNTSNCMKVYGLSFSTRDGGAGIGWPYRDKSCDFESAADDAAGQGQHTIAWFWRCHKPNLYKQFGSRKYEKEQRIQACHRRMMELIVTQPVTVAFPDPEPTVTVNCEVGQHSNLHERIFEKCQQGK